jgi:formate/nitrite transporter
LLTLSILAGVFISLGAAFYTVTVAGAGLDGGLGRVAGGLAFSLGLILVVIGGAELFTGNNLIVMAWADRRITMAALLRNWGIVFVGNFAGALGTVALVAFSGVLGLDGGQVAETAREISRGKLALTPETAFFRGVLCNVLVCLAIWLSYASHRVSGKILAILFPVTAFVALGFEHSIANMYLIPIGFVAGVEVDIWGFIANLVPVTAGNIVGGGILVALVYWLVYGKRADS